MLNEVLAWFVRVAVRGVVVAPTVATPKFSNGGDKMVCVPVPLNETTCGLVTSLSVMVKVPVRVPVDLGLKVTLMMQLLG
jgi:hypothetical protein